MTREELLLNDFDGFKRFLFTEEERLLSEHIRWRKYYFKGDDNIFYFHPPIDQPKEISEYQLDHYALWMVIYVFRLRAKPIFYGRQVFAKCYACDFDREGECCPIKEWSQTDKISAPIPCVQGSYGKWAKTHDEEIPYEIAHYEWER